MRVFGRVVAAVGILCIFLPILAAISDLASGPDLSIALAYTPSFVLGGILLFVLGIGIRIYRSP